MSPLDELLAAGQLSKMDYILRRMQQAEEDAARIIAASPQANAARHALAFDQRHDSKPKPSKRYHD